MREREKTANHLKQLADQYTRGEHSLQPLLEFVIKSMPAQESKNAMMRYGFMPAKKDATVEKLSSDDQDKLNAVNLELQ